MDIERLQKLCLSLPHVTEDIKWGNDLCFSIGSKMFCVAGLQIPMSVSFKVRDEEFEEIVERPGITPAPYLARYKWVLVREMKTLSQKEWDHYIRQSYQIIKTKLPARVLKSLS